MGRQAYLTKIAFGRSAFEPSSTITQSSDYIQLSSSEDIPPIAREANANRHIQLYDDRGNPINPRAHEHGRTLREAQNDVLASIGVVARRQPLLEGLPGSYEECLEQLANEDIAGTGITFASNLSENVCTWWIGSLRQRILTFRMDQFVPFSRIVASERHLSGSSLIYGGYLSSTMFSFGVQAAVTTAIILRPIDRLLAATRATHRTKQLARRGSTLMLVCLRVFLEVVFYPFAYHSILQRIGIVPAMPLFPHWKAFIPFSRWSPITPFSLDWSLSVNSVMENAKTAMSSPLLIFLLWRFLEQSVYIAANEVIIDTVINPGNLEHATLGQSPKNRSSSIHNWRSQSPTLFQNAINSVLLAIGWGEELPVPSTHTEASVAQSIEVGGTQVMNVNRLQLPEVRSSSHEPDEGSDVNTALAVVSSPNNVLPPTPSSPTASEASQEDYNDPRIRITSREGMVEMEVRLPPQVIFSHTEVSGTGPATPTRPHIPSPVPVHFLATEKYYRVTHLSLQPSKMIGAVCKVQILRWAMLPLELVMFRLFACHYLASRRGYVGPYRVLDPFLNLRDVNLRSVGALISRVALCGTLEVAIDLALWGCQYMAVTWVGQKYFAWGTL
ncbi:hypothetical protein BDV95DRAFT_238840 [Massariosphaeria phaeospora]|uniref:Uncharacterized protein n=1 Tax=Massariosphaeria phaeospora TaxID=100035 RepID=A0A7C8MHC2_9PLEO|nr:hypothetical protein BDV95DRAFT_238840 [Massariosphaeria phaeospora]